MVMSLQVIPNSNNSSTKMVPNQPINGVSNGSAFKVYDKQEKASTKVKVGVTCTTIAGVIAAMAWTFKAHGLKLNGIKDFVHNLTHIKYAKDKNGKETYELEKLIGRLTLGSVGGGLLGGLVFDKKENYKAKFREAVIQVVGNIATPLVCVGFGIKSFQKHLSPMIIKKFNLKTNLQKGIPEAIASAACLVTGIILGNKIGNFINKKTFRVDDERKLKLTDMSPHIDDVCFAVGLVAPENAIGDIIKRFIPLALTLSGFSTGVAQECSHHNHTEKTNETKEVKQ